MGNRHACKVHVLHKWTKVARYRTLCTPASATHVLFMQKVCSDDDIINVRSIHVSINIFASTPPHSRPYTYCRASFTMVTFSDPKAYHILAYGTLLGCSYPKSTDKPPKTVLTSRQRHQPTSSRHSSQVLWLLKPFQDLNSGKQERQRDRDREPARKVNNTYLTTTPPAPYNKPFSPLISASKPSSPSLSLSHGPASDWSQ